MIDYVLIITSRKRVRLSELSAEWYSAVHPLVADTANDVLVGKKLTECIIIFLFQKA